MSRSIQNYFSYYFNGYIVFHSINIILNLSFHLAFTIVPNLPVSFTYTFKKKNMFPLLYLYLHASFFAVQILRNGISPSKIWELKTVIGPEKLPFQKGSIIFFSYLQKAKEGPFLHNSRILNIFHNLKVHQPNVSKMVSHF